MTAAKGIPNVQDLYMKFDGSGDLNGKVYGAVLGRVQGQVQMSPMWAEKTKE